MTVCIRSKYLGAQWAKKILNDWNCKVTLQSQDQSTKILITDQREERKYQGKFKGLKIVLEGVEISNAHCLARSGVLSTFGQHKQVFVPNFVVESIVANSLAILCLKHLYNHPQRIQQTFKVSVINLVKYFGAFFISAKANYLLTGERGTNILEGGSPFYSVYPCKQGMLAIGNLEPKFYKQMIKGLPLSEQQKQFWCDNQMSSDQYPKMRQMLISQFLQRTASQWQEHYKSFDTCITEVKQPFASSIVQPRLSPLHPKL